MMSPTAGNEQITAAVTQYNVKVVGEAPAMALGTIYHTFTYDTADLLEYAEIVQRQQIDVALACSNNNVMHTYSTHNT
ncbi:R body protein RebB-like protein [Pseudomonas aeruginosa]|nr:R body protein RebB-like protein [Pseudomonas aeruginosa]